jgi:hypothetical protein
VQELTDEGRATVEDVARRHGVSVATATTLLAALVAGRGAQAQFNVTELGGMGQWSRGGMTMVGDMFDTALKARVDALCSELAELARPDASGSAASQTQRQGAGVSLFVPGTGASEDWWPSGLGRPSSTGAQNDLRYAVFPETRRLAISNRGRVTVHDTGDHRIGGVAQAQAGDQSLSFTSQHGLVRVADLPEVGGPTDRQATPAVAAPPGAQRPDAPAPGGAGHSPPKAEAAARADGDDVFAKLERLAELHARGVLTAQEFEAKKADLLARL